MHRSRHRGPFVLDEEARLTVPHSNTPALDWVADLASAPNAGEHIPILCASSLMYDALKAVMSDPGRKNLSSATLEAIQEALACAE